MSETILVSTDLDRTLLPNGSAPESPGARDRFRRVAERSETRIAYVTGRHLELVVEAIRDYDLPWPDYLVGDVGTSIYTAVEGEWRLDEDWHAEIGTSWGSGVREELARVFVAVEELRLQPDERQGPYKLSYYTPLEFGAEPGRVDALEREVGRRGLEASLIWSRDDAAGLGLLDVLPDQVGKHRAVEFLMRKEDVALANTLFAGDSGNDLPALASPIPAVLVANASEDVRREAVRRAEAAGTRDALYLARGDFFGMNGNYSAGILEGLVHFVSAAASWLR